MDFVTIRLTSADDRAIRRMQSELRRIYPEMEFGPMRLDRAGDWACHGHYDAGAHPMPLGLSSDDDVAIQEWFRLYKRIRPIIVRMLAPNHPALQALDHAMRGAASWTVGKQRR